MPKRSLQLVILLASLLPAQTPPKSNPAPISPPIQATVDTSMATQIALLRSHVDSLEKDVASLKNLSRAAATQIASHRSHIASLEREVATLKTLSRGHAEQIVSTTSDVSRLSHSRAEFDPSEPDKWVRVDTDAGSLLVSVKGVEPYLDGCKLHLDVGNPNSFTVKSFNVNATWSRRLGNDENKADWFKSLRKKSFNLESQLLAGKRNPVVLILPDTDPSEVGYIEISLNVGTVAFGAY